MSTDVSVTVYKHTKTVFITSLINNNLMDDFLRSNIVWTHIAALQ